MNIQHVNYAEPRPPLPPQPSRAPASGFPFRIDILRSLRIHSLAATLVTLLSFCLGLALLAAHRPYYAATSVVYVSPTFPATLSPDREQEFPAYESYIAEQMHTVSRYDVLADALQQLKP